MKGNDTRGLCAVEEGWRSEAALGVRGA